MHAAPISWLDVVLILMLVTSITLGFHQGLIRQTFLLLAMYIATVLSAQYYGYLAVGIHATFPASEEMAGIVAFGVMVVFFTVVVAWVIWTAYTYTRLPDVVMLDSLGGAALGGVIGVMAISLSLVLARYAVQAPWPDGSPAKYYLLLGLNDSALQVAFKSPLPLIHAVLRPWLPEGIPLVLNG